MSAAIGRRLIVRARITSESWLGREQTWNVTAAAIVVEVLGRSVRVRINSISGIPCRFRCEATELMEGWHSLDTLGVKS